MRSKTQWHAGKHFTQESGDPTFGLLMVLKSAPPIPKEHCGVVAPFSRYAFTIPRPGLSNLFPQEANLRFRGPKMALSGQKGGSPGSCRLP